MKDVDPDFLSCVTNLYRRLRVAVLQRCTQMQMLVRWIISGYHPFRITTIVSAIISIPIFSRPIVLGSGAISDDKSHAFLTTNSKGSPPLLVGYATTMNKDFFDGLHAIDLV